MPNRWWIYQAQRFPLLRHTLLAGVLSTAAIGYAHQLVSLNSGVQPPTTPIWGGMVLSTIALLLFAFQRQVIDEFRDLKTDILYYPDRPVPRGLVTLPELQIGGWAAGCIQFGLAIPIGFPLMLLLALLWTYLGLLGRNFFQPALSPGVVLGRTIFMPLLALYAAAHYWLRSEIDWDWRFLWFLAVSLAIGLTIELSQTLPRFLPQPAAAPLLAELEFSTLRSPAQQFLEPSKITLAWLIGSWLLTMAALQSGRIIQFPIPITMISLVLLGLSVFVAQRFWARPSRPAAHALVQLTDLWAIGAYFNLGILPLLLATLAKPG